MSTIRAVYQRSDKSEGTAIELTGFEQVEDGAVVFCCEGEDCCNEDFVVSVTDKFVWGWFS